MRDGTNFNFSRWPVFDVLSAGVGRALKNFDLGAFNLKLLCRQVSPKTKRRLLRSATALLILGVLVWWSRTRHTELDRYKAQLIAQGEILDLDKLAPKRTGNEPDGDEPMRQAVRQMTNDLVPRTIYFHFTTTNGVQVFDWTFLSSHHHSNTLTRIQNGIAEIESKRPSLLILHQTLTNLPAEKGADYRQVTSYPIVNHVQRRTISQFLHHAIVLDAYAGRNGHAYTNLTTVLEMAQLHREEWSLMTQMVRTAVTKQALEDLNYGLALHSWNDAQLAVLHPQIASISLVTNVYQALIYERAVSLARFAQARQNAQSVVTNAYLVSQPFDLKLRAHTFLWSNLAIDDDELNFLKLSQYQLELIRPNLQTPRWSGVPEQLRSEWEKLVYPAQTYFSQLKLNLTASQYISMDRGLVTLLFAETRRQQALAAIALERHWLKHGRYPDTLEKLRPEYFPALPLDPINGRPLHYRLNADGTYTLWSVGMNGKDDGGDATIPASKRQEPQEARDLVWPRINPLDLPPKP